MNYFLRTSVCRTYSIHISYLLTHLLACQYWADSYVQWSPLGTHLATVHRQGVQVWVGDDKFRRLMKFSHPQVLVLLTVRNKLCRMFNVVRADMGLSQLKLIDFSPGERYLVTYSSHEPNNPRDTHVRDSRTFIFIFIRLTFMIPFLISCNCRVLS